MADVQLDFPDVEGMDLPQLYVRYEELLSGLKKMPDGRPDVTAIEDDVKLAEMARILGALRRKSAGPPKAARRTGLASAPKTAPDISQL